jgi:DNA-binding transcriptional LysR family regulator
MIETEVELREIRTFLVLAEELHFGRAAQRLFVSSSRVSQTIRTLESRVGGRLFDRTSRSVRLTAAGEQLRASVTEPYVQIQQAIRAGREALNAVEAAKLRVGLAATAAFPLTPLLLAAFRECHPEVAVSTRHFGFGDPTGGLLSGDVDIAIVRPPFSADGLELLVIAREPRYVALSTEHPLARRTGVRFEEIEDEPWIEADESDPVWCAFWRLTAQRTRPLRVGAQGQGLEDLLEAARTRQAVGVVAESVARAQPWPQLTFVQVTDIPPSEVALAWHTGKPTPPISEFIRIARNLPATSADLTEPDGNFRVGPLSR